jgi:hypothetical protein
VSRRLTLNLRGATRHVLLIGSVAVKVPALWSWRLFLSGLLANLQERDFSRAGWPELCPVLCAAPGGWLLVMRRAEPVPDALEIDFEALMDRPDYRVPAEAKRDSWGLLNGRVVAVDYGS